jgi:hypothetical protein
MTQPTYLTTCHECGGPLIPVAIPNPDAAPWLCVPCGRSWWVAELGSEARKTYRKGHGDFGLLHEDHVVRIRAAVDQERAAAHDRRTSMREDHVQLVSDTALVALTIHLQRVDSQHPLAKQIQTELARRGKKA